MADTARVWLTTRVCGRQRMCAADNARVRPTTLVCGQQCLWVVTSMYGSFFLSFFENFSKCFWLFKGEKNIFFKKFSNNGLVSKKNRKNFHHFLGGGVRTQSEKNHFFYFYFFLKASLNILPMLTIIAPCFAIFQCVFNVYSIYIQCTFIVLLCIHCLP